MILFVQFDLFFFSARRGGDRPLHTMGTNKGDFMRVCGMVGLLALLRGAMGAYNETVDDTSYLITYTGTWLKVGYLLNIGSVRNIPDE